MSAKEIAQRRAEASVSVAPEMKSWGSSTRTRSVQRAGLAPSAPEVQRPSVPRLRRSQRLYRSHPAKVELAIVARANVIKHRGMKVYMGGKASQWRPSALDDAIAPPQRGSAHLPSEIVRVRMMWTCAPTSVSTVSTNVEMRGESMAAEGKVGRVATVRPEIAVVARAAPASVAQALTASPLVSSLIVRNLVVAALATRPGADRGARTLGVRLIQAAVVRPSGRIAQTLAERARLTTTG